MTKKIKSLLITLAVSLIILAGCNQKEETKATDNEKQAMVENKTFTDDEKEKTKQKLIKWLAENEEGKAVSNRYFSTSSISNGDWYAQSEDGEIQINNKGEPGPEAFDLHALTGAVVYTSKDGKTGFDESAKELSNIEGYSKVADVKKPIKKYIFTKNGEVYEYEFEGQDDISLSSGFAPKDHNGKDPNLTPNEKFKLTENEKLSKYYKKLLSE